MTGARKPGSPGGERGAAVPTIAWGMLDVSGASAVNTRVHIDYPQRTRGCGCIGHPAFPAPSVCKGVTILARLRREVPRERGCVFRHGEQRKRRSNPAFPRATPWIASRALTLRRSHSLFDSRIHPRRPGQAQRDPGSICGRPPCRKKFFRCLIGSLASICPAC